jgi:hypothetical protein
MKTAIQYTRHTPELSDGFHHADCPVLFAIDTIGNLSDCPFPLKTDTFEVLAFGRTEKSPDNEPKHGHSHTFAVVRFTKGCGHTVEERIPFSEGVESFDHYGTRFEGADYSIANWQKRIEFFRQYPCDVCGLVKHSAWIWTQGLGESNRKRQIVRCIMLLDANFANWRDFIPEQSVRERFNVKRGSDLR